MSDIPTRIEVNCQTGEVTEHVLTEAEIAEREQMAAQFAEEQAAREAEAAAKEAAKEAAKAKFVALGLTDEEIAAIVG